MKERLRTLTVIQQEAQTRRRVEDTLYECAGCGATGTFTVQVIGYEQAADLANKIGILEQEINPTMRFRTMETPKGLELQVWKQASWMTCGVVREDQDAGILAESLQEEISDPWELLRQAVREVSNQAVPGELEVKREGEAKIPEMIEFVKSVGIEKPSQADVDRAIEIIRTEGRLGESRAPLQEVWINYLEYIWFSLKSAWYLFDRMINIVPMQVAGYKVTAHAIAILIAVMYYLCSVYFTDMLRSWASNFTSWVKKVWNYKIIPLRNIDYDRSALKYLDVDIEYVSDTDIPSLDAYDVTGPSQIIGRGVPFEFIGFASPRWSKKQYVLVEPLAGHLKGEKRFVELESTRSIRKLSGEQIGV